MRNSFGIENEESFNQLIESLKEREKKESVYKQFNRVSLFKKIKNAIYKILSKFF